MHRSTLDLFGEICPSVVTLHGNDTLYLTRFVQWHTGPIFDKHEYSKRNLFRGYSTLFTRNRVILFALSADFFPNENEKRFRKIHPRIQTFCRRNIALIASLEKRKRTRRGIFFDPLSFDPLVYLLFSSRANYAKQRKEISPTLPNEATQLWKDRSGEGMDEERKRKDVLSRVLLSLPLHSVFFVSLFR